MLADPKTFEQQFKQLGLLYHLRQHRRINNDEPRDLQDSLTNRNMHPPEPPDPP
jgi:hypothetical protein